MYDGLGEEEEEQKDVSLAPLLNCRHPNPPSMKKQYLLKRRAFKFTRERRSAAANGKSKHLRDFPPFGGAGDLAASAQFNLLHAKQFGRQRRLGFGQKIAPAALPLLCSALSLGLFMPSNRSGHIPPRPPTATHSLSATGRAWLRGAAEAAAAAAVRE